MPPLQKKVRACYAQVQPYLKGGKVASQVELEYLPNSYGDACSGVGTSPEEVLFHELVHLSQIVHGYLLETPIPKAPHMTNFTEFCAVTASNILRSELGRPGLRAGHEGRKEATTLTDPKDYYAFYKDEINQWFRIQAVLCGALSRVNAPFNPLRAKKAAEPAIQAVFR
jgi:hypothetical protein